LRKLVALVVVDRADVVGELLGVHVPLAQDLLAQLAEVGEGENVPLEPHLVVTLIGGNLQIFSISFTTSMSYDTSSVGPAGST
jgi:hypothetical protein